MPSWLLVPFILEAVSPLLAFEVICEPKSLQMAVGNNTSLRCFWKCESEKCAAERIIWTKDGHVLQSHPPLKNQNNQTVNGRFQFMYYNVGNGNISVDIKNLQNSNEGTYSCIIIIDGAYGQGTIHLQVSDPDEKHNKNVTEQTDSVTPEKQEINWMALRLGVVAAPLVFVIAVLSFVLWKKRLGCSHCQKKKKLPKTGYREDTNRSTGVDSTELELIQNTINHDGTEESVNLATT